MSPRLASAITIRSCSEAKAQIRCSADSPWPPSASKKATCGFTATASSATDSISAMQKRS